MLRFTLSATSLADGVSHKKNNSLHRKLVLIRDLFRMSSGCFGYVSPKLNIKVSFEIDYMKKDIIFSNCYLLQMAVSHP